MIITRRSQLTGYVHVMDLPVTGEELDRIDYGELIQKVLPHLTPSQREFLKTGITDEEWDEYLGGGEE